MSSLHHRALVARNQREFWRGAAWGLHVVSFMVMLGVFLITETTGTTIYSTHGYDWFTKHWPYKDRAWGAVFGTLAFLGSMTWWVRGRIMRFVSALALGCGHIAIAYALWSVNPVVFGVATYATVAVASVLVIVIRIFADW
jgi:hypothetical protein